MKDLKLKWNLDNILPLKKFDNKLEELYKKLERFQEFFKLMSPDMKESDFKLFLEFKEEIGEEYSHLAYLPELMEATDSKSQEANLLKEKIKTFGIKYEEAAIKISHWIKGKEVEGKEALDDKNAERLFKAVPDLTYALTHSRESAKYTLSEDIEKIISNKDINGIDVLVDLRTLIETEFTYRFQPEGTQERIIQTEAELRSYAYSKDPKERKACYKSLLNKQEENLQKFFMIYQAVVKSWNYEAKLRGYKSAISIRNHANHVPDEAIETLLKVCTKNRKIFQDYFRFKAKELNMKKLTRYDIYAPLKSSSMEIPFSKALLLVLETLNEFSSNFKAKAQEIVDNNHIDSHPSNTKRGGAFCATISPKISPYIMLNHSNKTRDVSTLAHELGHGIHSLYANKHYPSTQHANLPLAETASTFAEMLLFDKLLQEAKDKETKKEMLSDRLADSYATILRQNYFVKFEIEAHKKIQEGITAKELSELWLKTLKEQFEDSIDIDQSFKYEWCYIPHIVETPFYCYSYSFGLLLSLSLYAQYKKMGHSFVPKIEKILSYGGSENPQKVLKEIGIDMNSEKFWQSSFEIIKEWQTQLENL